MATYSTGVTASWGGTPFTEITSLSVSASGDRQGRSANWSPGVTSVSLNCLGSANMSSSEVGLRKNLTVSGGGVSYSGYAVCLSVSATPQLNGITQYAASFKSVE